MKSKNTPLEQIERSLAALEALLTRAAERIRHDHAYPMEIGDHHHPRPRDRTAHNPGGRQVNDYDNGEPITIWPPTTIQQTARERLSELIRAGGIAWKEANDPDWRGKPWMDGVLVDVDESDVVDAIVDRIITGSDPDAPASSARPPRHFCEICKGVADHKTVDHPWPSREEATDE